MGPNRREREGGRSAAERKAAKQAQEIVSRAQRAASRRRMRKTLIRDAAIAILVAILFGVAWKQIVVILTGVAVP
jgi:uncharacterized membrane protein YdbT with pleckstrin-like domain